MALNKMKVLVKFSFEFKRTASSYLIIYLLRESTAKHLRE